MALESKYDLWPSVGVYKQQNRIEIKNKKQYVEKNNYCCHYCNCKYKKYLICTSIGRSVRVCCRACYIITHLNFGNGSEIMLCHSSMTQRDIVKKTVDLVKKTNGVPYPTMIDPDVELVTLSMMEFLNILIYFKSVPKALSNFKIFFTQKFNTHFIENNIDEYMFVDPENIDIIDHAEEIDQNNGEIKHPKIHHYTAEETQFLESFFSGKFLDMEKSMIEFIELANQDKFLLKQSEDHHTELIKNINMLFPPK